MYNNNRYTEQLNQKIRNLTYNKIPKSIPLHEYENRYTGSDEEMYPYSDEEKYPYNNKEYFHDQERREDITKTNPENPFTSHVLDINETVFCVLSKSINEILNQYKTAADMLEHKNDIMAHCLTIIECAEKTHNYSPKQLCQGIIRGAALGWCYDEKWQVVIAFFLLTATCMEIHSMPVDNHLFMLHVPKKNGQEKYSSLENISGRPQKKIMSGTVEVKVSPEIGQHIASWKNMFQRFQALLYHSPPPA